VVAPESSLRRTFPLMNFMTEAKVVLVERRGKKRELGDSTIPKIFNETE
jgi:hypothetical protein